MTANNLKFEARKFSLNKLPYFANKENIETEKNREVLQDGQTALVMKNSPIYPTLIQHIENLCLKTLDEENRPGITEIDVLNLRIKRLAFAEVINSIEEKCDRALQAKAYLDKIENQKK